MSIAYLQVFIASSVFGIPTEGIITNSRATRRWRDSPGNWIRTALSPLESFKGKPVHLLVGLSLLSYNIFQSNVFNALMVHTSMHFGFYRSRKRFHTFHRTLRRSHVHWAYDLLCPECFPPYEEEQLRYSTDLDVAHQESTSGAALTRAADPIIGSHGMCHTAMAGILHHHPAGDRTVYAFFHQGVFYEPVRERESTVRIGSIGDDGNTRKHTRPTCSRRLAKLLFPRYRHLLCSSWLEHCGVSFAACRLFSLRHDGLGFSMIEAAYNLVSEPGGG
jgi:hypothetical protein